MNAAHDAIDFLPTCQALKWEREMERTMPTIDGQIMAPEYAPAHRREAYAEQLAVWCRANPERPRWLRHSIACGYVKP